MKKVYVAALVLLCCKPLAALEVGDLRWLSGCWSQPGSDAGSVEHWSLPAGGTLLGYSRTVHEGRTVAFEYLRIVAAETGKMVLFAAPSGQSPVQFHLQESGPREVVFENLYHDFPHRIIYRSENRNRLLGRIEGIVDGESRSVDFRYSRISCGLNE